MGKFECQRLTWITHTARQNYQKKPPNTVYSPSSENITVLKRVFTAYRTFLRCARIQNCAIINVCAIGGHFPRFSQVSTRCVNFRLLAALEKNFTFLRRAFRLENDKFWQILQKVERVLTLKS